MIQVGRSIYRLLSFAAGSRASHFITSLVSLLFPHVRTDACDTDSTHLPHLTLPHLTNGCNGWIDQAAVPDVPPEVDIQLQRQQIVIDKIFNNVGDDDIAVEKVRCRFRRLCVRV